ncbi:MAG: beta-N-acetylhexosaminidase, partial [Sphingobacteriaceae bacterium]
MTKFKLWAIFIACFTLAAKAQTFNPTSTLIPAPQKISSNTQQFVLDAQSRIEYGADQNLPIARLLQNYISTVYGFKLSLVAKTEGKRISLVENTAANYVSESYSLHIGDSQIQLKGKGAGLFYAAETLLQLFPAKSEVLVLKGLDIEDWPRYAYRGMHLDVGRHFFPVSFIKEYIDLLASYKLNTFHWHLTEDQGWRIEIKKYPKLTQIGGYRAQTLVGNYHDRFPQLFDQTPYGGFYTQDEIKEVVAYAQQRFVTIIPEIEMPGHSLAALSAYPELACGDTTGPFLSAEKWGVFDDVYCAGKESTFTFLEDVLDEVMALFPSKYIHIGGDESPKTRWKVCPYCQKRIKANKLADEHELQSYFIQRIEKYLNSKDRQIIGWDEILEGGLAPNATVMSWRGTDGGIAAAKQNHNAIMTPGDYLYFDHAQGKSNQEPLSIGGYTPLEQVYNYNPTPSNLTPAQQARIVGVQANMWTEYMTNPAKVEYMLLPRIYALSEIAWTNPERKDWINFVTQAVPEHLAKLDQTTINYRVPTAIGIKDTTMLGEEFTFNLQAPVKGAKIYYTVDGYTPDATTELYTKPFTVKVLPDGQRIVKTRVISPSGKQSVVTTTILDNSLPLVANANPGLLPGLQAYFVPGVFNYTKEIDTLKANEEAIVPSVALGKYRNMARTFGLVMNGF